MKRCKHLNGELIEYATIANNKHLIHGILDDIGINDIGNITGYKYHCLDCNKAWKFKAIPKLQWLASIYNQMRVQI